MAAAGGVAANVNGIGASSTFRTEREATLRKGESMNIGPFTVRLDNVYSRDEPQRTVSMRGLHISAVPREVGG